MIKIDKSAVDAARKILASDKTMLRLGVKGGACEGYQYVVTTDDQLKSSDELIVVDDVKFVVDKKSMNFLSGSTLKYVSTLMKSSFEFENNPRELSRCSCGSSFSIKD